MGKENWIGLSVIDLLCIAFVGAIGHRVLSGAEVSAIEAAGLEHVQSTSESIDFNQQQHSRQSIAAAAPDSSFTSTWFVSSSATADSSGDDLASTASDRYVEVEFELAARRAAAFSPKLTVVEEGGTLFEIAKHELGKVSRWGEIHELNCAILGDDYDFIRRN